MVGVMRALERDPGLYGEVGGWQEEWSYLLREPDPGSPPVDPEAG